MIRSKPARNGGDVVRLYVDLYIDLVRDIADSFGVSSKESRRDIQEIEYRVSQEGLSFLTKALPRLGKCLDKALSQECKFAPAGFQKKPSSTIPKFLGWLFELVFDSSGIEKPDSDTRAVLEIRQLVYFLYKLEMPHTPESERKLLSEFVSVDQNLPAILPEDIRTECARNLVTSVFGSFDTRNIKPRHGPGAVATGERNYEKHIFSRLYKKLDAVYPFTEYFMSGLSHIADCPEYLESLQILEDGTAKVVLVPKDSRGPRIISCEPLEYQWMQQALGNGIRDFLERHRLTSGQVNFTSQEINRSLARSSSVDQQWVTLDMKEASDRVSMALVKDLFRDCPVLLEALMATRSARTTLPNGDVVELNKFAPMGSNLCFPIQAVVFWSLAVASIVVDRLAGRSLGRPHCKVKASPSDSSFLYRRLVSGAARRVFVYGDDIIMRKEDYLLALQYFPTVGLMFNQDKCCTAGFFRESCGMDAYKGVPVAPLRLKRVWCHRRVDPVVVTSYIEFSNSLYKRNYCRASERILSVVETLVGVLPVLPAYTIEYSPTTFARSHICENRYGGWYWVRDGSRALVQRRGIVIRWNTDWQRFEVKTRQAAYKPISVYAGDWCMVLRRLTSPSEHDEPGVFALTGRSFCKPVWIPIT